MIIVNGNLQRLDEFTPERMTLNLEERKSTAVLTLGPDHPELSTGDWLLDDTEPGAGIVWRVKSVDTELGTNTRTVQMEHIINTLKDYILFGETTPADVTGNKKAETCSAEATARYCLRRQDVWALGDFEFSKSEPYNFNGDSIFSALETITGSLEDAYWEYDMSRVPFRLHIRKLSSAVTSEMRTDRNIQTLKKTIDRSRMYTRFYPIGKNDLHLSGDYVSKNENIYGRVDHVETDGSMDTEGKLRSWANERLARHCEPSVTVQISGLDLSEATGEPLDHFTLNHKCRVPLPEYGTTIVEKVTKLNWQDKIHEKEKVSITLANLLEDVASIINNANKTSAKGGRTKAKKDKEDHAWIVDTEDHVGLVAEAVAGPGADKDWSRVSSIFVDGEGIHQMVKRTEADVVTAFTRIEANEYQIELEANRRIAGDTELQGKITVEADRITQEVIQRKAGQEELSARITVTASQIRQEVKDTKNSLSSQIVQTASQIRHEVSDTKNSLNSRITQTASQIRQEVSDTKNSLSSSITQTASQIRAEVKDTKNHLESSITQTASQIRSEVRDGINGVNSSITQTASQIRSEVRDSINGVNSSITQTASQIRSEVNNSINGVNSSITQTASQIRSEVSNSINGVNSSITQTASQIRSEVNNSINGLSSSITQTASQIRQEVSDTKNGLQASITTNANNIELKVSKNGVISSINQTSESVTINASKINLNGYVNTSNLATSIANVATLHTNTLYADVNLYYANGLSYTQGLWSISLTESNGTYTLKQTTLGGTETTVGTFSRATTLSGAWSSGKFTVSASPQGNSYWTEIVQGAASWNENTATVPIEATDSTSGGNQYATGRNISVDASARYTAGRNNTKVSGPTWSNGTPYTGGNNNRINFTTDAPSPVSGASVGLDLYVTQGSWSGTSLPVYLRTGSNKGNIVAQTTVSSPWLFADVAATADQGPLPWGHNYSLVGDGVTLGTWSVASPNLQEKSVSSNGDVTPDSGYDGLSKVTVSGVKTNVYALKCTGATQQGGIVTYTFTTSGGSFSTGTTYNFWR